MYVEVTLNIRKILLASLIYPIVYPRAVLNAVTLPILLLICNWAIAANLGRQYPFFAWLSYALQFYGVSIYLTNCLLLVLKNEKAHFFQHQYIYIKCSLLLMGFTFFLFAVKYYFVMLGINIFAVSGTENFTLLDEIVQLLTKALLFSFFFVIPHYIYVGEINIKAVLARTRKHVIGIAMTVVIVELFKGVVAYLFSASTSTGIIGILFGSTLLLILQGIEYIIIAFCYMAIFSKHSPSQ